MRYVVNNVVSHAISAVATGPERLQRCLYLLIATGAGSRLLTLVSFAREEGPCFEGRALAHDVPDSLPRSVACLVVFIIIAHHVDDCANGVVGLGCFGSTLSRFYRLGAPRMGSSSSSSSSLIESMILRRAGAERTSRWYSKNKVIWQCTIAHFEWSRRLHLRYRSAVAACWSGCSERTSVYPHLTTVGLEQAMRNMGGIGAGQSIFAGLRLRGQVMRRMPE